jgi:hypothetical protein
MQINLFTNKDYKRNLLSLGCQAVEDWLRNRLSGCLHIKIYTLSAALKVNETI